jgi:hypothetical protein
MRTFTTIVLALCAMTAPAMAASWNAVDDFSTGSLSPTPWAYGGSVNPMNPANFDQTGFVAYSYTADLVGWQDSSFHWVLGNTTDSPIVAAGVTAPAKSLILHPSSTDERAVVRWTAPSDGKFSVDALFEGASPNGTTTDVGVYVNGGSPEQSGEVDGFGDQVVVNNLMLMLAAGDHVDFTVGVGSNGTFNSDSTAFRATITQAQVIPLPASAVLLLGGLASFGFMRRRS